MINIEALQEKLEKDKDLKSYQSILSNYLELQKYVKSLADLCDDIYEKKSKLKFKSPHALVIEYGDFFCGTIESSLQGEVKQCYKNCFNAMLNDKNLIYCEGYAIDSELPISLLHAWLIDTNRENKVIDPTWKEKNDTIYYGIAFKKQYVIEFYDKNKCYSILENAYLNTNQLLEKGFPSSALYAIA